MPIKAIFQKRTVDGGRNVFINAPPHGEVQLTCVDVFLAANGKWAVGTHYDQAAANKAVSRLKCGASLSWPRVLLKRDGNVVASTITPIPTKLPSGAYIFAMEIC